MLKPTQTKKRKRSDLAAEPGRTVAGSAFAACPICGKQVPLLTINIHLGSTDCSRVSPSLIQQHTQPTSGQKQRDQQTATPNVATPAVLQLQQTSSDSPLRYSEHVADAVQHAALQPVISKLPAPATNCNTSVVVPSDGRYQLSNDAVIPFLKASPAVTSSPCNHKPSDTSQASTSGATQLFLTPHADLKGEYRIPDFVTAQEELDLVRMLDAVAPQWKDSTFNGKHRGKRWGAEMDLHKRTVVEGSAMPPVLTALITRMQQLPLLQSFEPNEANAIDYRKALGHWLKPHVDDRQLSTDKIVTLSLVGSAVMTFSCKKKDHSVCVELPARTLQVITKEARYMYTHGIAKQALFGARRVSVTFRQSPFKR